MARIYTRTGDKGETGLFGGGRVSKDSTRVEAYGSIDELNSVLGVVRSFLADKEFDSILCRVQDDLFVAGADLATVKKDQEMSRITAERVLELERTIDRYERELPPLNSFILPSGSIVGSALHFARAVARRSERQIVRLARSEGINDQMIPYINRLSDLLFVLARVANRRDGKSEVEWHIQP